jgi:hypothetical protein
MSLCPEVASSAVTFCRCMVKGNWVAFKATLQPEYMVADVTTCKGLV